MSLATADLPSDPEALRAFALACQAELKAAELSVQLRTLEIEKLKFQIAKLRRMQFGRSSERITRQIEQLELRLEELETGDSAEIAKAEAHDPAVVLPKTTGKVLVRAIAAVYCRNFRTPDSGYCGNAHVLDGAPSHCRRQSPESARA